MLALPLQALASASMLACTFSHQPAPQQAVSDAAAMGGCHDPAQTDAPSASHTCKHCAACALGSALPIPTGGSLAIATLTRSFPPIAAVSFAGVVPDGPERPPRPRLA